MRDVRLWIKKEGRAKYISHLDMNRCFTRAVRRAGINLWYTEGFNPHPYLNFLTPLSLGQESDGEPLDIRILDSMGNDEIMARMNDVLPEGISVCAVTDCEGKTAEIAFAEYCIVLDFEDEKKASVFSEEAVRIFENGNLFAEKTGKKGRQKVSKQVDICTLTKSFSVTAEGETAVINAVLSTGAENLNPTLLVSALNEKLGKEELLHIRRKRFFKADMSVFV